MILRSIGTNVGSLIHLLNQYFVLLDYLAMLPIAAVACNGQQGYLDTPVRCLTILFFLLRRTPKVATGHLCSDWMCCRSVRQ